MTTHEEWLGLRPGRPTVSQSDIVVHRWKFKRAKKPLEDAIALLGEMECTRIRPLIYPSVVAAHDVVIDTVRARLREGAAAAEHIFQTLGVVADEFEATQRRIENDANRIRP